MFHPNFQLNYIFKNICSHNIQFSLLLMGSLLVDWWKKYNPPLRGWKFITVLRLSMEIWWNIHSWINLEAWMEEEEEEGILKNGCKTICIVDRSYAIPKSVSPWGLSMWTCNNIFLTSEFSYLLFCNTHPPIRLKQQRLQICGNY